jgi:RNA polymerase sigma factor (sigma-70 family)
MGKDLELWNEFLEGDRRALADLFCAHYDFLEKYGRKLIDNEDVLQDLIQDLFIDLWMKKSQPPITSIQGYLIGALRNKIFSHFKTNKKRAESPFPEAEFQISIEDFIIEEEDKLFEINKLLLALDKIPPRQREILYLRFYCKLEYADICSLMGITYQVARNQLSSAVTRVKTIISENS